jgi:hypothetical protein
MIKWPSRSVLGASPPLPWLAGGLAVGVAARPVRSPGLALRTSGAAVRAPDLAVHAEATRAMVARITIMAGFTLKILTMPT